MHLLTSREKEVLSLIAKSKRSKEIAEAMSVSEETVKSHIKHIYEKLGIGSRKEAVAKFIEHQE